MKLITIILAVMTMTSGAEAFTLVAPDPNMQGWDTDVLRFHLNTENCPAGVETLIDDAIDLWNGIPTSGLRLERGNDTAETLAEQSAGVGVDIPGIFCVPNMAAVGVDANSIPGLATGFRMTGSHVSNGFLILNVDPSGRANIQNLNQTLVKVVVAHEIGHVMGLGHSEDRAALMYYDATAKSHLSLAADDVHGMTYLYPRDELSGKDKMLGCSVVGGVVDGDHEGKLWLVFLILAPLFFVATRRYDNV